MNSESSIRIPGIPGILAAAGSNLVISAYCILPGLILARHLLWVEFHSRNTAIISPASVAAHTRDAGRVARFFSRLGRRLNTLCCLVFAHICHALGCLGEETS